MTPLSNRIESDDDIKLAERRPPESVRTLSRAPMSSVEGMESERTSRYTRRRQQTRDALLGAARALIAEGRASEASIQEITDRADVGFGSFYNHFDTKAELFAVAAE